MMKSISKGYWQCILMVCLVFAACMPEIIELPSRVKSVTTNSPTDVTINSATLNAHVDLVDTYNVDCGVIYGLRLNLSPNNDRKKSTTANGNYSVKVSELKPNTTYYYRAYALDADVYKYGKVYTFKTDVSVTTGQARDITDNTATIEGDVNSSGQSLTCGIIYGTSSSLSSSSGTKKSTTSSGTFSVSLTGLNPNTTYYYRAYAVVDGEYRYGDVLSFTTTIKEVTVSTGSATDVTDNGASLSGTINNSDKSLTCGIIYGTSSSLSSSSGTKKSTTSSGTFSVSLSGLSPNTTYYYRAYVVVDGEYKYGEVLPFTTKSTPKAVDLGLSVKWASFNIGASFPEDYGGYYAWGETEEKSNYSWSTYKWCNGSLDTITKYRTYSSSGTVDNKATLDLSDDVAHVKWGGSWRMPTFDEIKELINDCSWSWTTQNGVNGYKVTGPNRNSIFLPAAGYRSGDYVIDRGSRGNYWSSTLDSRYSCNAYCLGFGSSSHGFDYDYRDDGYTVRPVTD